MAPLFLTAVFCSVLYAATHLTEAQPDDGKVYSQIARNLVEQGVYSTENTAPYSPTLIRVPGYPIFLAAVYEIAGIEDVRAVRAAQGALHFATAVLAGLLGYLWCAGKKRRRRKAAFAAIVLAAACPFTLIYTGVMLTETSATFLLLATLAAATAALRSKTLKASLAWWAGAGLLAGLGVEVRPDAGLFAAGVGVVLVVSAAFAARGRELRATVASLASPAAVFGLVFVLILTPWTIRNYRVFGLFQPIAPENAEMPGEFVPHGYILWLRTWITDISEVNAFWWTIEKERIDPAKLPPRAFTSDEDRAEVAGLLDRYNDSDPDHPLKKVTENDAGDDAADDSEKSDEADGNDADPADTDADASDQPEELDLKITPESDAEFRAIAERRIAERPFEFYAEMPARRAVSMWFDTHSEYYPYAGEVFPLKDLDGETLQNVWLPVFAALVWVYTLLAVAGAVTEFAAGRQQNLFVFLALAVTVPRLVYISLFSFPEPRYLVEYFAITAVFAGLLLSRLSFRAKRGAASVSFNYGRRRANG